jgi:hypothetical protein
MTGIILLAISAYFGITCIIEDAASITSSILN